MNDLPGAVQLWQPSPIDARFAPDAFDSQIGQPILVTLPGPPPSTVSRILRAYTVNPEGTEALLTLEAGDADD